YDSFGINTKSINADGSYSVYEYDSVLRQTGVKQYDSGNVLLAYSKMYFDGDGHLTAKRQKAAPGGADGTSDGLTEFVYDANGRVVTEKVWLDASNSRLMISAYDSAGRLTKTTDGDGFDTTFAS